MKTRSIDSSESNRINAAAESIARACEKSGDEPIIWVLAAMQFSASLTLNASASLESFLHNAKIIFNSCKSVKTRIEECDA